MIRRWFGIKFLLWDGNKDNYRIDELNYLAKPVKVDYYCQYCKKGIDKPNCNWIMSWYENSELLVYMICCSDECYFKTLNNLDSYSLTY
jgi:hypothetical protein